MTPQRRTKGMDTKPITEKLKGSERIGLIFLLYIQTEDSHRQAAQQLIYPY
jgi:hypothetical protein